MQLTFWALESCVRSIKQDWSLKNVLLFWRPLISKQNLIIQY